MQIPLILKDLNKKMVILVGPRQAGKTWVAKRIASEFNHSLYLNYDQISDQKIIAEQSWLPSTELLILDELHKMPFWKNYLKGFYDTKPATMRVLVTGSARLDIFNQLGDSLAGRYFRHRLLPFSPAELSQISASVSIEKLLKRGGFPEPYLAENDTEAERWRLQYLHGLLSSDVFEFNQIQNLKAIQLIFKLLRNRVGSPVSYQSIAEDVGVSSATVKKYIQILEALYIVFIVTPFSNNIARSLLKEPKIYFFDTGLVEGDEGARLENLTAICLLKNIYGRYDYLAEDYQLNYIRTKDGEEVDFALIKEGVIQQLIEVKNSDHSLSPSLVKFQKKNQCKAIQVVRHSNYEIQRNGIEILKIDSFLKSLWL